MAFAFVFGRDGRPPRVFPGDLSGLLLWCREGGTWQDLAGSFPASANGDPVARWDDLSGQAHHLVVVADGNRPQLQVPAAAGKPGLLFDGSDDWLLNGAAGAALSGEDVPCTLVIVVSRPSTGTQTMLGVSSSVSNNRFHDLRFGANRIEQQRRDDATNLVIVQGAVGLDTARHVVISRFTGTEVTIWQDLVLKAGPASCDVGVLTLNRVGVGANPRLTPTQFLAGTVYELAIYDRALSDTERIKLTQYLRGRWGIEA
jgi:hypothetical protein